MSTKEFPGTFDCYANAADDEPMFILLARDPDAPKIVRLWCVFREMLIEAGIKPPSDLAAVAEAKQCAYAMERWRQRRDSIVTNEQFEMLGDIHDKPDQAQIREGAL